MTTPDRELLRELSTLRELLEPVPGDSAPPQPRPQPAPAVAVTTAQPLLDLAQIFDDDFEPSASSALPRFILQDAVTAPARTAREALIEALVAERLPRLEAALRERLTSLDDNALRAWAEADSETAD